MLNFSKGTGSEIRSQHGSLAAILLDGVAKECARLAEEIVQLGETLSAHKDIAPYTPNIVEMQRFDMLSQNARAQAGIMQSLALILSGRETLRPDDARSLIAMIPLREVRARLLAMSDEIAAPATLESSSDEDWLFE